ncbi:MULTISPECIES: histidine phosphatase family protein [unclassified Streptomyces]|uniref:histidine phosphatase family protein n=1 Tax=unclassified Streptomyces TaxID=2593676 RepID=UPI002035737B|nr:MULTISPECIES: histidine phosphatase family protein [unclassified Streptomyces]
MSTKHVYLVKHGETEENARGIHQGRAVGGILSKRGRDGIRTLAAAGIAGRPDARQPDVPVP